MKWLSVCLLCLLCVNAWADASSSADNGPADGKWRNASSADDQKHLQSVAAQLANSLPVHGQMQQHKYMAILNEPLVSSGTFDLKTNGDLTWSVQEPFAVLYRIVDGTIMRTLEGEQTEITARKEPSVYGFFQIVGKLFDLQLKGLESFFTVQLPHSELDAQWQLRLLPNNKRLASAIAAIVVTGEQGRLHNVTVQEPNADYTRIQFQYAAQAEE
ncbi:outer membrane lipoprotein carrier protein LolA [Gilvimarinus agarilyticus]|uniref:outer membrane lipoprotein carrier protein LolA n=1 Tax=Gilvimarinus sp. 2_MG-2023 TaxID=3062666 RepID=UPI001C087FEF|nr:outer membrane lipoprotein carrier protein LolA [Gilvimarinus sp. 2_MG-2023]MBU2885705.1 outer membrane lipoprotein carrier protein LolA [Gilvimarinus agarilyticus]MDO6570565.1 outer membrane lipoprotein carrier protein LolA [Gilvimarinus sp. 2_MG-2023]